MKVLVIVLCLLYFEWSPASQVAPEVPQKFRKLDPITGKIEWSKRIPRDLIASRCESYPGRVVVYCFPVQLSSDYDLDIPRSRVMFLDSRTARNAKPFDTLDYRFEEADPLLASSGRRWGALDPRNELQLSNGWTSYGFGVLPGWQTGSKTLHFTHRFLEPVWTLYLPDGAHNLTSWQDILLFVASDRSERETRKLFAQRAGEDSVLWEFAPFKPATGASDRRKALFARVGLKVFPGKQELFAVSSGTLFALEPASGKVLWSYKVNTDPIIRKEGAVFLSMELLDMGEYLLLTADRLMVKFNKGEKRVERVLLRDVLSSPVPYLSEGAVYCFTTDTHRGRQEKSVIVPANKATKYRLISLMDSFQRTLSERAELVVFKDVTNGMPVSLTPEVITESVWDFKEPRDTETDIGTDVLDAWGRPFQLSFSFGGFSDNNAGEVQSSIVVRARSFGFNRKDDGGSGDDLVLQKSIVVAETIHQEASSRSSNQSSFLGESAAVILRLKKE